MEPVCMSPGLFVMHITFGVVEMCAVLVTCYLVVRSSWKKKDKDGHG